MKKLVILPIILLILFSAQAQVNNSLRYSSHFRSLGALSMPSYMGDDIKNAQVYLGGVYAYGSNTALSFDLVNDFLQTDDLGNDGDLLNEILKETGNSELIGAGVITRPIGVFAKVNNNEGSEMVTFALGTETYAMMSMEYNSTLLDLVWNGNKQFAGQRIQTGPLKLNTYVNTEYFIAAAAPVYKSESLTLKPGVRLRFINSVASVYMPKGDLTLDFSDTTGRSIIVEPEYEYNQALAFGEDFDNSDDLSVANLFNTGAGFGMGVDLSMTATIQEKLNITAGISDIGSIRYKKNTKSYFRSESYTYEGVEVDIIDLKDNQEIDYDPGDIIESLEPDSSFSPYTMPLATRLIIQGEYQTGRNVSNDSKEAEYFKHRVFFTYVQGFKNHVNSTTRPFVSAGYSYNLANILNVGASASLGGFNKFAFGPFFSVRAGFFRLGFGSNNLLPLLSPTMGTGADFNFSMALSF